MRRATIKRDGQAQRLFISIHALHEESDSNILDMSKLPALFQSTLSMRRATYAARDYQHALEISIHALHEESDLGGVSVSAPILISIHALHEESDVSVSGNVTDSLISIHALHEESDRLIRNHRAVQAYFNPRSP